MTGTSSEPTNTAVLLTAATCRSSTAVPRRGTEHSRAFILLVACFLFLSPPLDTQQAFGNSPVSSTSVSESGPNTAGLP